ncbi:MAG: rhomboid family intramembrane serine protease [Bacteroidota bacterium]|nr:rhomboid family intramembrane serine protease [Bacteroidota bacterium]
MGLSDRDYYRPRGFGGFNLLPIVIKNLLIINAAVFFLQIIFDNLTFDGLPGWYVLNRYFGLNPLMGIDQVGQAYNFQFWQIITYQFMHGDFGHVFFNMFMLWMFGMEIENLWGSRKFLVFYLSCGIGAAILQLFLAPLLSAGLGVTIGASGAVFGIMIAFAMFFPDRYIFLYFLLPIKAKYLMGILVVFEFMSVGDMSFVAHLAHIGGALTGVIFILSERKFNFNFDKIFDSLKAGFGLKNSRSSNTFRRTSKDFFGRSRDVSEAEFYEINKKENDPSNIDQNEIDRILDKISQSGYQNLSNEEKRILFEASKKK